MYRGIEVEGLAFFELLNESQDFCAELGRVVLAAGRLESLILGLVQAPEGEAPFHRSTLGQLIAYAEKHKDLKPLVPHLKEVKNQRNYLTHSIYALLSDQIEETRLERHGLLDSDVSTYTERAWELKNNLNALADIVERA
ncbi:hypothetical protein [Gilvimarinus japonicus]|uniref:Uncharacterized protein n=1 Tax=Gilvimarinus japonicus TaxID=1796469 RepID=A0ABV7HL37_9GAMM